MRTRHRIAPGAALFLVLTATAATAQCPVADDLATGIRFIASDGTAEVHRRLDADRIEVDYLTPGSPEISRSIVIHGSYVQWYGTLGADGQIIEGTTATTGRPMQPSEMPVPEPGLEWVTSQVFSDAGGTVQETMRVRVDGPSTWQLGSCSYEALTVTVEVSDAASADGFTYTERTRYLPELGTGVFVEYQDGQGSSEYVYTGITVEEAN